MRTKAPVILLVAAILLLTACGVSLWQRKTIGLYGAIEPRNTIFYWLIVATYGGLGALSLLAAIRMLLR